MELFEQFGLPPSTINLVRALYDENYCDISVGGTRFQGFTLTSGVRQGCPLSSLLYAICAEPLLDKLRLSCPGLVVRAYEDDTVAVSEDIRRDGPVIAKVFEEFVSFSGLELNLGIKPS